jgi:(2Fe-2S) ferredoxin
MSPCKSNQTSFQLEGRFLSFVVKDGYKIKGLRLATAVGELYIKLSKESRASCRQVLSPGEWLQVTGYQQLDYEAGTVKYKAERIQVVAPGAIADPSAAPETPVLVGQGATPRALTNGAAAVSKACILVCQKSDCCKRGSRAVAAAIKQTLGDRQLTPQVTVKDTGCMKQCKSGANVVIQKTRYSHITPADVPGLIDRHFSASTPSATPPEQQRF